jgi:hypothetical protein
LNRQPPETNPRVTPGVYPRTGPVPDNPAPSRPLRISGNTVPDGECELVGIDAGVLYVRSDRRIADASSVTVAFDHTQLSGYVTGCQPTEDEWVISIEVASGRRREERIPTGEQFTVGIVSNNGTVRCQGTVVDKSASGLGVRFSRSVAPGTRIYVEMESVMALGEVRHCSATTNGQFIAGVAIVEFLPDSRGRNKFTEILDRLRWKLAAGIRGRTNPAHRP